MLKKQVIVTDFILPEIERLGFKQVNVNEPYCPLRLTCFPKTEFVKKVSVEKNNSDLETDVSYFFSETVYKLYFMFGKDKDNKMSLFCKENPEDELCRITDGEVIFYFDAKMFFHILRFAEADVWRAFVKNVMVHDEKEVENFAELLFNSHDLFEEQQIRGAMFLGIY